MIQLIKEKFLKNKFSIVIIMILAIIIIFMQTKLSFKDSKKKHHQKMKRILILKTLNKDLLKLEKHKIKYMMKI